MDILIILERVCGHILATNTKAIEVLGLDASSPQWQGGMIEKEERNYGAIGYNIFERVAKEGRKYGFLLGNSSQRPNELSQTVVSQCSNFIIHRIQNPDDKTYISRMVSCVNFEMINRMTYLQTGHALVFGSAIKIPTITSFEQANPGPDSKSASNGRLSPRRRMSADKKILVIFEYILLLKIIILKKIKIEVEI